MIKKIYNLKFGERLKELREEKGLSAVKLSKIIGVDDATILRWESGKMKPSIEYLNPICDFFGVTADYMLGRED